MNGYDKKITVRIPESGMQWRLQPLETSPCTLACPTRINARGYVTLTADGKFGEALALIRERNPFPGVCGRVCPRPCEAACTRGEHDEAVAICALKRFVFDIEMKRGVDAGAPARIYRKDKIAVVGAGPAGLSAAYELAGFGYPVTMFEAARYPGGMMNLIPEYRLPRRVVDREIEIILRRGIELVTESRFGRDITWNSLRRKGYKALILATGAAKRKWRLDRKASPQIMHALELLELKDESVLSGRKVVVIGNGMMALDAARTAVRLGCSRVTLITEQSRELIPVLPDDHEEARREGVKFIYLTRVDRLARAEKKIKGVRCIGLTEGEADATGRREILELEDSSLFVDADLVIDAGTRDIDVKGIGKEFPLRLNRAGTLSVERGTMNAGAKGIFAAGDLVSGPRSVVEAIASGQKAARGVHAALSGKGVAGPFDVSSPDRAPRREYALERSPERAEPRYPMPMEETRTRKRDFREVEQGYSERMAKLEAQRCLRCGTCAECTVCTDICDKKDFELSLPEGASLTIHAERDFWSLQPGPLLLDLDGEDLEGSAERTICRVGAELCIGCGRCEYVCGFQAVKVNAFPGGRFLAQVNEVACKGCGNCVSVCPTGAMEQVHYERAHLRESLASIEPGITRVLFLCRWAAPERMDLPDDVLAVEMKCSGRITPSLIVEAARKGSRSIMICGCDETSCHYGSGRSLAAAAAGRARDILRLLGCSDRMIAESSCDPVSFHDAVHSWIRRRR
jgi:NADPH-dependent glutamate synthase beta subunit-like oxidoreductase/coenzyme F420-reducing hydrogenase delta subunit/Pyruvate/2-oxoacid:ferredoxin oxidoreductase delta subunit